MNKPSSIMQTVAAHSRIISGGLWTVFNAALMVVEGISHDKVAAGGAFGLMTAAVANLAKGTKAEPFSAPVSLAASLAFIGTGLAHRDVLTTGFGVGCGLGALELYYENSPLSRMINKVAHVTAGKAATVAYTAANIPLWMEAAKLVHQGDPKKAVAVAVISTGFLTGNAIAGMTPQVEETISSRPCASLKIPSLDA